MKVTRDSHKLANQPESRESDTDSQGGPHMVRVAESPGVTPDSHGLANEPDSRESDTDSHTPICESTNTAKTFQCPYKEETTFVDSDSPIL